MRTLPLRNGRSPLRATVGAWSRVFFALVVGFLGAAPPSQGAVVLTRQQAVNAVVAQLGLGGPNDDTRLWLSTSDFGFGPGFEGVMPPGTIVQPATTQLSVNPGNTLTLSGPMYLFFADPTPNEGFSHLVKFVYVDATVSSPTIAAGTMISQNQGIWPNIAPGGGPGFDIFDGNTRTSFAPSGYLNPDGLVFGPSASLLVIKPEPQWPDALFKHETDPTRGGGGPAPTNPAGIVITGTGPGAADTYEAAMDGSADRMKGQLTGHGVPAGRIQDKRNAKKSDIAAAVTAICALVPAPDKIFVYIGTHGDKGKLLLGADGWVPEKDIQDLLKPLGAKNAQVCLMIEACHSGSLIDGLRKLFPRGLIITGADADNETWGGSIRKADGTKKGNEGFFSWAFIECWNDPAADTDGDGRVNWSEAFIWVTTAPHGKVKWHTNGKDYDTNSKNPKKSGLPEKVEQWRGPISGTWYTEIWRDTDGDGEYDQHDWAIDADCNGIAEWIYLEDDKNEDGKPESVYCFQYNNTTGAPIMRVHFIDSNSDGKWDSITRENWNGSAWVLNATALPRTLSGVGNIIPSSGPNSGGTPVQIQSALPWSTPNISVFVGSHLSGVSLPNANTIIGQTNGYRPGPHDVVVVDFNISSPTRGFIQYVAPTSFDYTRNLGLDSIDPPSIACGESGTMLLHGVNFTPTTQVSINGVPVPASFLGPTLLSAPIPAGCAQTVDVAVYDGLMSSTLQGAFTYGPAPDTIFPNIIPPAPITVTAGPDGLGRAPASFVATASDNSGAVSVFTDNLGALPLGTWPVQFEAIDPSLNRVYAGSQITVQAAPPCPGDINGDGHTNTVDLTILLGHFGQIGPNIPGDLNHDGRVNTADLTILLGNFGC